MLSQRTPEQVDQHLLADQIRTRARNAGQVIVTEGQVCEQFCARIVQAQARIEAHSVKTGGALNFADPIAIETDGAGLTGDNLPVVLEGPRRRGVGGDKTPEVGLRQ